jgi:DNA-binding MarR family transcriptional regulator
VHGVTVKAAINAWESLFRAQVAVMRTLSAEFPRGEISLTEYDVLFTISQQPNRSIRLRDLRKQVLLTQPSVSRLIDRLLERGLVSKCPEPDDARGAVVRLTDAGYDLYRGFAVQHGRSIAKHVGGALTPDELEQLQRLSDKLRAAVEHEAEHEPAARPERGPEDFTATERAS